MSRDFEFELDKETLETLRPIIEATRVELRDRDKLDVPPSLVKISKSSARRLPPPLSRSVVGELVANDDLRDAVKTRLVDTEHDSGSLALFLEDPKEGLAAIQEAGRSATLEEALGELRIAQIANDDLKADLKVAKKRLSDERTSHAREIEATRSTVSDAHQRAVNQVAALRLKEKGLREDITKLETRVSELQTDLEANEQKNTAAAQKRQRQGQSDTSPRQTSDITKSPSDPVELARMLDNLERKTRSFRSVSDALERSPDSHEIDSPLRIPLGIAPDSPEALDSLVAQSPERIIIDGYNVSGELHGKGFSTRNARDVVVRYAQSLGRRTSAKVIVVFDGPSASEVSEFTSDAGISVRFSTGESADDAIKDLVDAQPDRTVVITNDMELRQRCTVEGCIPIWSTAMVAFLQAGW